VLRQCATTLARAVSAQFTPTGEQQTAPDAFATGGSLVIEAGAGSGKTSTLRLLKAKGRGWDRVRIAADVREPKIDKDTGERAPIPREEAMLDYVSVTRAKQVLDNEGPSRRGGTELNTELVEWAHAVSRARLADVLPRRWAHVQSAAAEARRVARLTGDDGDLLVAAALLHDVGYAPHIATTGFHPLDGARYLVSLGASTRLTALVARHCWAALEAEMRGLGREIAEFVDEATATRDALWYCDMVTGPDGERLRFEERVAEIRQRYGETDLVSRFIAKAASGELGAAVERTTARMTLAGIPQPR
jgi:HD domain